MIPTIYLSLWLRLWWLTFISLHFSGHLCVRLWIPKDPAQAMVFALPPSPHLSHCCIFANPCQHLSESAKHYFFIFFCKKCEQMWLILADNLLLCWSILPRNLGNLWTVRRFPFDLWFISGSVLLKSTGALCSLSHSKGHPSCISKYYFAQEHLPGLIAISPVILYKATNYVTEHQTLLVTTECLCRLGYLNLQSQVNFQ